MRGRPESECIGGNGKMFAVSLQNINDSNDSNKILQNISESDINKSRQNAITLRIAFFIFEKLAAQY